MFAEALAAGDIKPVQHLVDAYLRSHGVALPRESPSYRRLGYALLKAAARANDALRERHSGHIVDTAPTRAVALKSVQKKTGALQRHM